MDIIGLILLLIVFWFNKSKPKSYVIFIVAIVYLLNMWVSQSVLDRYLNDIIGYYVSQSVFEVIVVLMLLQKPLVEGVVIMALCLMAVLVNIVGFTFEVLGNPIDGLINYTMWGLFAAQLIILFSTRAANGILRAFTSISLVRCFCVTYLKINIKGQ